MQKAHTYNPSKHMVTPDWYVSEKFDGRYFLWDGGATRGLPAKEVPWANTIKDKHDFVSTGMWSSQGKVVNVPDNIAGQLPPYLLDGEIWEGRGMFQSTMSKTRKYADDQWEGVTLLLFGTPTVEQFTIPRTIKYLAGDVHFKGIPSDSEIKLADSGIKLFKDFIKWGATFPLTSNVKVVSNETIGSFMKAFKIIDIQSALKQLLGAVLELKGEGLVLRAPWNYWRPDRLHDILKVKPFKDAEGEIIGYMTGRETDKGSTLLGKIGAYVIKSETLGSKTLGSKTFELSGMNHALRELPDDAMEWAMENPEKRLPEEFHKDIDSFGKLVTFRYRELTKDGMPKEARFLRFRED